MQADILLPDVASDSALPGGRLLLDPAAFAVPAGQSVGNSGRNSFRGPGLYSFDLSLSRAFRLRRLGETARVTVRADAFNLADYDAEAHECDPASSAVGHPVPP
jgi:hypothetical protein